MPVPGDTLRMSVANPITVDYSKTGIDTTWDFSFLTKSNQVIDTFVSVSTVPPLYWLMFTPTIVSNLASPGSYAIPIPGFTISDMFNFYKNDQASFNFLGLAFMFSGLPIMMKYNSPDVLYSFPCTMGTSWNSHAASSANLPGLGYYSTDRQRSSVVDGWGTLITPYGSYQTIRVKSNYIEDDSIYLDTLGMGFPLLRNVTEYKWLAKDQGEPLLTITEEMGNTAVVYRDIINHPGIGEKHLLPLVIGPNPVVTSFFVQVDGFKGNTLLSLFDGSGKEVLRQIISITDSKSNVITCDHLAPGVYVARIRIDGQLYSGKLIKK